MHYNHRNRRKLYIWDQGKEDILLLTFVTRVKGFALSFSLCMYNLCCKFVLILDMYGVQVFVCFILLSIEDKHRNKQPGFPPTS